MKKDFISESKKRYFDAVKIFSDKIYCFQNVLECGIIGSLASDDPYPQNINIYLVINFFENIDAIAKAARQISSTFHDWSVFVLSEKFEFCGFLCQRKKCPAKSIECSDNDCGKIELIRKSKNFKFDKELFLTSPRIILFTREQNNYFDKWRAVNGITEIKEYEKFKTLIIKCIGCGRRFRFLAEEQKHFKSRGFQLPKRCQKCRDEKNYGESFHGGGDDFDDYDDIFEPTKLN